MSKLKNEKQMSWFWLSGGSILTQIKKMRAAKYNKTPTSPVNPDHYVITNTCSFSNFNLQDKILLCFAWFTLIPGTWEMFSQVAIDIYLIHTPKHYNSLLIRHHLLISSLLGPKPFTTFWLLRNSIKYNVSRF